MTTQIYVKKIANRILISLLKLSKIIKFIVATMLQAMKMKIDLDSNYLSNLRVKNINRLLTGNLNINSISNRFQKLKLFARGKVDILVIMETKLDSTNRNWDVALFMF